MQDFSKLNTFDLSLVLKFKFVWTKTGTEFVFYSAEISVKAYFNFTILSLTNTYINEGKNLVKFRLKPNFFSQFRFRFNRNRTFEKQVRFGSAEFLKFVCTLPQPQLVQSSKLVVASLSCVELGQAQPKLVFSIFPLFHTSHQKEGWFLKIG